MTKRTQTSSEPGWKALRLFEFIVNTSRDCMSLVNRDYVYEAANQAYLDGQGKRREEVVGRSVADVWGREVFEGTIKGYMDRCLQGHQIRYEAEFPFRGREKAWYEVAYSPYRDEGGLVTHVVVVSRDVTERRRAQEALERAKRQLEARVAERTGELSLVNERLQREIHGHEAAEEALRNSEERHRLLFETMAQGVVYHDAEGRVIAANPAAERILGFEYDQLRLALPDPVHWKAGVQSSPDLAEEEHPSLTALRTGRPVRDALMGVFNPRLGAYRWLHVTAVPLFRPGELRPHQVYTTFADVTEQRQMEEALIQALSVKQAIFKSIPDTVITVDEEMRVIETNHPLGQACGLPGEEGAGFDLAGAAARGCPCHEVLRQTLTTKQPIRGYKDRCRSSAFAGRALELSGSPLLDESGRFAGAVLVVRDVSRLEDLEQQLKEHTGLGGMKGGSEPMRAVFDLVAQLADLETTVLVTGDSGTGKELVAEALHAGGGRRDGPLIKVNCSALSENLLESELFGHVRGAFSGAVRDKTGRFQAAQGGTLFLDEIGDVSPLIQLKLLRVLENKEFERVGESRTRKADVRIVAATNRDLEAKVRQGVFREDLYFRLKVMRIHLPPLRERKEDIPLLARHFLDHFRSVMEKDIAGLAPDALARLMRHSWPGNVRELRHCLEHACILCPGGLIRPEHLPPEVGASAEALRDPGQGRPGLSAETLQEALERAQGKKARAARLLGVSRSTLYRMLRREETGRV